MNDNTKNQNFENDINYIALPTTNFSSNSYQDSFFSNSTDNSRNSLKLHNIHNEDFAKDEDVISKLKDQNSNLLQQLKEMGKIRDESIQKQKTYLHKMNLLQDFNKKLQEENSNLKILTNSQAEQIKEYHCQCLAAKASNQEAESAFTATQNKNKSFKKAHEFLSKLLEDQKDDLTFFSNSRSNLITQLQKCQSLIQISLQIIEKLTNENKILHQKLSNSYEKTQNEKNSEEGESSQLILDFSKLPQEIIPLIMNIANNNSIAPSSKTKHLINIITQWYENQLVNYKSENKNLHQNALKYKMAIQRLIYQIKQSLGYQIEFKSIQVDQMNLDNLLDDEIHKINEIEYSLSSIQQKFDAINNSNLEICREFSISRPIYIHDFIIKMKEDLFQRNHLIEKMSSTISDLKKDRKKLVKALKVSQIKIEDQSLLINALQQKANEDKRKFTEAIDDFQQQIEKFKLELDNEKSLRTKIEKESLEKMNNAIEKEKEASSKHHNSLIEKIKELTLNLNSIKAQKQQEQQKNAELEKVLDTIKKRYIDSERRVNNLLSQSENNQTSSKTDGKIKKLEEQYNDALNTVKMQKEEDEKLIQKLSNALTASEERVREAINQNTELTYELDKSKIQTKNETENIERSKRLIEGQLKAQIFAVQNKLTLEMENARMAFEKEKRDMITYLGNHLNLEFDMNHNLNEEIYYQMIETLKKKFLNYQKQEESIRMLIHANQSESLEEAITSYIISHHPQLQSKEEKQIFM